MKKIVIVGGGTAGWLSALFIKKILGPDKDITVIASDDIGIIGAGEGSTGLLTDVVNNRLWDFGCNERDFINETNSTLKFGIKHVGWHKSDSAYFGPIDFSKTVFQPIDTLQNYCFSQGASGHLTTGNGYLFDNGLSSFFKEDSEYYQKGIRCTNSHAYHFDAVLVGQYFKKICTKAGVKFIEGTVTDVSVNDNGIESVVVNNETISADFFVDASGFKRILSNKLNVGWKSYAKNLPVDRAMPFVIQHDADARYENYTTAQAMPAGWMWAIPTQERIGYGYVYSSKHCTAEQAQQHVEHKLQRSIEPIKHIEFESGCLESFWNKNCLSVGLAAAFAEPLEATSIHTTIVQLFEFCTSYQNNPQGYNEHISKVYDDMRDFLVVHYLNKRTDTDFWKQVNDGSNLTPGVERVLELCKTKVPKINDWESYYGSISSPLYNIILYNLGYIDKNIAREELQEVNLFDTAMKEWLDDSTDMYNICAQLKYHTDYIKGIKNYDRV